MTSEYLTICTRSGRSGRDKIPSYDELSAGTLFLRKFHLSKGVLTPRAATWTRRRPPSFRRDRLHTCQTHQAADSRDPTVLVKTPLGPTPAAWGTVAGTQPAGPCTQHATHAPGQTEAAKK